MRRAPCWLAFALAATAGCSSSGPLAGGASANQMKSSLSHLQFENEQLRTEIAKLKEENRSMEDRLVQEQLHAGDLAARLDNARNLLRDRGIDSDTRLGSRQRPAAEDENQDAPGRTRNRPRTLPAGQSTRKPRKPPTAAISGDLDAALPYAPDDDGGTISLKAPGAPRARSRLRDDPAPSSGDDDFVWQPVLQAREEPQTPSSRR